MTTPAEQPDPGIADALAEEIVPGVTRRHALVAQMHAVHVQGGAATIEGEAARLAKDMADQHAPAVWLEDTIAKMAEEVAAAADAAEAPAPDDAPPVPDTGLPLDKVRAYKRLRELQAASDSEAKALKEEADALEAQLVELFAEQGLQNMNIDGKTVYLHRSTYAQRINGATAEDVKAALRASGQNDLITETVNANTLSAFVREIVDSDEGGELPAPLADVLELGERYSLRINAAGSRSKSKTHSK